MDPARHPQHRLRDPILGATMITTVTMIIIIIVRLIVLVIVMLLIVWLIIIMIIITIITIIVVVVVVMMVIRIYPWRTGAPSPRSSPSKPRSRTDKDKFEANGIECSTVYYDII